MINDPTRAMIMAHILHKHKPASPNGSPALVLNQWADIVRHAWYFVRFRHWLNDHVVKFSYFKKDGSIRQAIGTTNLFFVPHAKHPLNGLVDCRNKSCQTITYFDLGKQEWRCFDIRNFIGYVQLWPEL